MKRNKFWGAIPVGVAMVLVGGLPVVQARAENLPVEKAVLTEPPLVPPLITRDQPAKVVVELEVREVVKTIADGVKYTFWTFGGTVPGRFIRVREGDTVEFHLRNHQNNKLPHNIDLHAVTGPGGGATSTFTAPGHETQFTFKALNPGLFVYHCATAPVGMHIANGMYGLIHVQPKEGMPKVDREYYVMQGDFYTPDEFGKKGHQPFSMEKAIAEHPSYVVFNGSAQSLLGDNALKAKVGETVRLFVGNGGPNLVSSFHVIGEIFDKVFTEGGSREQNHVQTTLIPAGGSSIVEFKLDTAGTFILVDHSIFRAFNKGALGMMKVEGPENKGVYSGQEVDKIYLGDESVASSLLAQGKEEPESKADKPKLTASQVPPKRTGKQIFDTTCALCHQASAMGIPGAFPPLAKSDYLLKIATSKDRSHLVKIVSQGLNGKITVNGQDYNGVMTPVAGLSDDEMAGVLTYVTNTFGNKAPAFTTEEVRKYREKLGQGAPAPAH